MKLKILLFLMILFFLQVLSLERTFAKEINGSDINPYKELNCSSLINKKKENEVLVKLTKSSHNKSSNELYLVVHGLNLNPEKMSDVVNIINNNGADVISVSLQGHRMDLDSKKRLNNFKSVTNEIWKEDVICAYKFIKNKFPQKKIHFLGYSLGGLIGVALINDSKIKIESLTLIAPAISVYPLFYLTRVVSMFPRMTYPSLAPKAYRANSKTPLASYNAIYDLLQELKPFNAEKFSLKTTLILAEEDELIDNEGIIEDFLKKYALNWNTVTLSPLKTNDLPRHLNISKENLSSEDLETLSKALKSHLSRP
jgi:esterase/lipase